MWCRQRIDREETNQRQDGPHSWTSLRGNLEPALNLVWAFHFDQLERRNCCLGGHNLKQIVDQLVLKWQSHHRDDNVTRHISHSCTKQTNYSDIEPSCNLLTLPMFVGN